MGQDYSNKDDARVARKVVEYISMPTMEKLFEFRSEDGGVWISEATDRESGKRQIASTFLEWDLANNTLDDETKREKLRLILQRVLSEFATIDKQGTDVIGILETLSGHLYKRRR